MKSGNPIIFLDFDGVLNSELFYRTRKTKTDQLDRAAIARLNTLCVDTGAKVVVSSTWRLYRTVDELQTILTSYGFTGQVIGKTKDLHDGPLENRGIEIEDWLAANRALTDADQYDYNRYVILDDDSDFTFNQRFNLIVVDGYVGMTPKTVHQAKRILTTAVSYWDSP